MKSLSGSNVLVIGGAGLIGSHLVGQLVAEDAEVRVFDNLARGSLTNLQGVSKTRNVSVVRGDIRRKEEVEEALRGVDFVFHLAALWLLQCAEDPRAALDANIGGTLNVLEACRDAKVEKLVFSSSASVYGDALMIPMTEEHPFNNRTMYGATKIAGEQLCRAFAEMFGLRYVALRYMNVYGPRQDYRGAYVSVIMKVLDRIDQNLPPIIYGDGSQSYDFIYVEDTARANLLALKSPVADEVFNVGTGIRTTIRELVETLLDLVGSGLRPEYREGPTFVQHRVGSTEKAERLLGFKATVPLREGLRRLIAWRGQELAQPTVR